MPLVGTWPARTTGLTESHRVLVLVLIVYLFVYDTNILIVVIITR